MKIFRGTKLRLLFRCQKGEIWGWFWWGFLGGLIGNGWRKSVSWRWILGIGSFCRLGRIIVWILIGFIVIELFFREMRNPFCWVLFLMWKFVFREDIFWGWLLEIIWLIWRNYLVFRYNILDMTLYRSFFNEYILVSDNLLES